MSKKKKPSFWKYLSDGPFSHPEPGQPKPNLFFRILKTIILSPIYLLIFIILIICSIFTGLGTKPEDDK